MQAVQAGQVGLRGEADSASALYAAVEAHHHVRLALQLCYDMHNLIL